MHTFCKSTACTLSAKALHARFLQKHCMHAFCKSTACTFLQAPNIRTSTSNRPPRHTQTMPVLHTLKSKGYTHTLKHKTSHEPPPSPPHAQQSRSAGWRGLHRLCTPHPRHWLRWLLPSPPHPPSPVKLCVCDCDLFMHA
jgi:hypothetical protein